MKNVWQALPKPISILAPMDDVADTVFRRIVATCGRPDLFFTEFASCEGICSKGRKHVEHRLKFDKSERPLIAQIWGLQPKNFYETAKIAKEMGFDGIDLNMGCPVRDVVKSGACSALIKNPSLAKELIAATKEGAQGLPVSVKTRIGYSTIQTEEWIPFLLEQNIAALTVHGRTVAEQSLVPAHWDEIGKSVAIRNKLKKETLIIGNGDIKSFAEGEEKCKTYGLDGYMIGRGIFENPWIFNKTIDQAAITQKQRLELLLEHVALFEKTWEGKKNYAILKKFFKIYVRNFDGALDLRVKLMETKNGAETKAVIAPLLSA